MRASAPRCRRSGSIRRQIMRRQRRGGRAAGPRHDRHRGQQRGADDAAAIMSSGRFAPIMPGPARTASCHGQRRRFRRSGRPWGDLSAQCGSARRERRSSSGQHVPVVVHADPPVQVGAGRPCRSPPAAGRNAQQSLSPSKRTGCPTGGAAQARHAAIGYQLARLDADCPPPWRCPDGVGMPAPVSAATACRSGGARPVIAPTGSCAVRGPSLAKRGSSPRAADQRASAANCLAPRTAITTCPSRATAEGRGQRMAIADPLRRLPGIKVQRVAGGQHAKTARQTWRRQLSPPARSARADQRRHDRPAGKQPGDQVAQLSPIFRGGRPLLRCRPSAPTWPARPDHRPAGRGRPLLPKARDRAIDQPRICPQRIRPRPSRAATPGEIFHHHIDPRGDAYAMSQMRRISRGPARWLCAAIVQREQRAFAVLNGPIWRNRRLGRLDLMTSAPRSAISAVQRAARTRDRSSTRIPARASCSKGGKPKARST